ncbi:MAG: hypothetical protein JNK82_14280 [Myxococcaceae bacterium]|nr:hypothetical protein [Myxococcaceae bacterium]
MNGGLGLRRAAKNGALLVASLAAGLAFAELGAWALHRGAYPYLNLFVADARYGVRLMPSASTRVRSRDGRVTDLTTGSLGFRGPEWPLEAPQGERVLLLGDSQVMGYGVPFESAMGEALGRLTGAEVLTAAVPSWGPNESALALEDLGPDFRPTQVVFVANAANDWYERLPNTQRTSARDGWATLPGAEASHDFFGRGWLLGRSHLVLAGRQLLRFIGTAEHPSAVMPQRLARDVERLRGEPSPVSTALARVVEACRGLSCRVVAVALPLDAQVSAAEWQKYRATPVDLTGSEALLDDFVEDARARGVPARSLLGPLRAAGPGMFLPDDYHLSAAGHAVVAAALHELTLRSGAEVRR